jgi:hypothetical protein
VKAVINLRVPKKVLILLTSRVTVSFPRRTLLHGVNCVSSNHYTILKFRTIENLLNGGKMPVISQVFNNDSAP